MEHLWDDVREKSFHNRVFDSIESLEAHREQALADFEQSPKRTRGITGWPWIINALSNWKWNYTGSLSSAHNVREQIDGKLP